jgi:8-amino-7-oxononanoate synthase
MFEEAIKLAKEKGLYRELVSRIPGEGAEIVIDDKTYLSYSSNDYLGLSRHPLLIQAGRDALERFGAGSGASRLLSGSLHPHHAFESEIARFKKTESALLFGSGYLANLALLSTLAKEGDLILADRLNHASLMDGCRLSRATFKLFKHRDMDHLRHLLGKRTKRQKTWIISEGVFSMEGDLANLPELINAARQFEAELILDDAHGFGVMGNHGRGTTEHFNLEGETKIEMGTLGKAAGLYGAFVAGPRSLIDYLVNRAKPFIYTTSLPPIVPAMGIISLKLLSEGTELRSRLKENQGFLSSQLRDSGFSVPEGVTPILPVLIGDNFKTMQFSKALFDEGLYIPAIRPPTVPEGKSRLRISLSALHTRAQLEKCVYFMTKWGKTLGVV